MAGKKSGKTGFVNAGGLVSGINLWSLDYTVDMLETTDFSASGVGSFIPGVSRWSGTFSGYKDGAPVALGVAATASITLGETGDAGENWTGSCYINGIHPSNNFDGVMSYAYDFQGTGALTVASA